MRPFAIDKINKMRINVDAAEESVQGCDHFTARRAGCELSLGQGVPRSSTRRGTIATPEGTSFPYSCKVGSPAIHPKD